MGIYGHKVRALGFLDFGACVLGGLVGDFMEMAQRLHTRLMV